LKPAEHRRIAALRLEMHVDQEQALVAERPLRRQWLATAGKGIIVRRHATGAKRELRWRADDRVGGVRSGAGPRHEREPSVGTVQHRDANVAARLTPVVPVFRGDVDRVVAWAAERGDGVQQHSIDRHRAHRPVVGSARIILYFLHGDQIRRTQIAHHDFRQPRHPRRRRIGAQVFQVEAGDRKLGRIGRRYLRTWAHQPIEQKEPDAGHQHLVSTEIVVDDARDRTGEAVASHRVGKPST
jgi:hypothetical protein